MIDYEDLRLFAKVAELQSFTKASQELRVQSSYLSRRIAQLESHLGIRLLQRTTRRVALTDEGRRFLADIHQGLRSLEQAVEAVHSTHGAPEGLVRVASPVEFGNFIIERVLPGFFDEYPGIRIEWDLSSDERNLIELGFDLAIRAGRPKEESFVIRKLGLSRFQAFVSPSFQLPRGLATKSPLKLANIRAGETEKLEQLPWVLFTPHLHSTSRDIVRYCTADRELEFRPKNVRFRSNNLTAVRNAVIQGLGIGFLPAFMFEDEVQRRCIERFLPKLQWRPEVEFYLAYPSREHLPPKTRVLIEWIQKRVSLKDV